MKAILQKREEVEDYVLPKTKTAKYITSYEVLPHREIWEARENCNFDR